MQDRDFGAGDTGGGTGESGQPSGFGGSAPGLGDTPGFGSTAGAGSANRPEFGASPEGISTGTANRLGGSGGDLADTLQELQGRADHLMDEAADQLDGVAQRIDELADRAPDGGLGARAGNLAEGAADTLESVARFLRDNDVSTLQRDLGRIVSAHPVQAVLAAVGAGFIVGKVLR